MPSTTRAAAGSVPCADDPERMFPLYASQRRGQEPTEGERASLAVCERCPVLAPCREAVLTVSPLTHGVAGGMTAMQRREARATRHGLTGSTAGSPTPAAPIGPVVAEVLAVQTGAGARNRGPGHRRPARRRAQPDDGVPVGGRSGGRGDAHQWRAARSGRPQPGGAAAPGAPLAGPLHRRRAPGSGLPRGGGRDRAAAPARPPARERSARHRVGGERGVSGHRRRRGVMTIRWGWQPFAWEQRGLPTWRWGYAPRGLVTRRQMRTEPGPRLGPPGRAGGVPGPARGPGGSPSALGRHELVAKRTASPAQLVAVGRALAATRWCPGCARVVGYCIPTSLGVCGRCAFADEAAEHGDAVGELGRDRRAVEVDRVAA